MEEYVAVSFPYIEKLNESFSIDVDLPIICDDEYWIHPDPDLAFKQPESKPSVVASWVCGIGLLHILAVALRTLVSCWDLTNNFFSIDVFIVFRQQVFAAFRSLWSTFWRGNGV